MKKIDSSIKDSVLSNQPQPGREDGQLYSYVGPCLVSIARQDSEKANENPDICQKFGANPSEFATRVFRLLDSARNDQAIVLLGESDAGRAIASRSILHRIRELSAPPESASAAIWERLQQVQSHFV